MKLKVGMKVKLLSDIQKLRKVMRNHYGWDDPMEKMAGKEYTVEQVYTDLIRLNEDPHSYSFHPSAFEPAHEITRENAFDMFVRGEITESQYEKVMK